MNLQPYYWLLYILIPAQSFVAGMYLQNQLEWSGLTVRSRLVSLLVTLLILVAGSVLAVAGGVIILIAALHIRIWKALNMGFMVKYVWLRRPLPHTREKHAVIHAMAEKYKKNLKWYQFGRKSYIWIAGWIGRNYGTHCPHCGKRVFNSLKFNNFPENACDGDFVICLNCTAINVLYDGYKLRRPTDAEWQKYADNQPLKKLLADVILYVIPWENGASNFTH